MLVLSRKPNQKIKIGEDIEITIVSISGDNIRIGIDAPKNVKILRAEVYEEVKNQNTSAIKSLKVTNNLKNLLNAVTKTGE